MSISSKRCGFWVFGSYTVCLHLAVNNAEHKNCIFVFVSALNRRKQQIALLPVSVQGHNRLFKFSSVQFKLVSMSSEKSICTPPHVSEVSQTSPAFETVPMFV